MLGACRSAAQRGTPTHKHACCILGACQMLPAIWPLHAYLLAAHMVHQHAQQMLFCSTCMHPFAPQHVCCQVSWGCMPTLQFPSKPLAPAMRPANCLLKERSKQPPTLLQCAAGSTHAACNTRHASCPHARPHAYQPISACAYPCSAGAACIRSLHAYRPSARMLHPACHANSCVMDACMAPFTPLRACCQVGGVACPAIPQQAPESAIRHAICPFNARWA